MCGIIHCKRLDGRVAQKSVLKRYEKQKSRGSDGFGFIEINNGVVGAEIRTQTEKEIKEKLKESKADEIMFHHRFPTSTPNFIEATHPIKVSHKSLRYDYYLMHNGIISNDDVLRKAHLEQGFDYTTEIKKKWITKGKTYFEHMWNDSEALAIDFCLAIERGHNMASKGSIAMVAIQFDKKTRRIEALYFGRNQGNPLKVESSKDLFCLSSESGTGIGTDVLYRIDYHTGTETEIPMKIGKYEYSYSQYDYTGGMGTDKDYDDYPRHPSWKGKGEDNEDEFDIAKWEEIAELEQEMRICESMGDYDRMTEIQIDIEDLYLELGMSQSDIDDMSINKIINNGQKQIGFSTDIKDDDKKDKF